MTNLKPIAWRFWSWTGAPQNVECVAAKLPFAVGGGYATWGHHGFKFLSKIQILSETVIHMGVSKNNGTPKSSILIGFSIINHPFWGTPIFGNTHIPCLLRSKLPWPPTKEWGKTLRWICLHARCLKSHCFLMVGMVINLIGDYVPAIRIPD